MKPTLFKQSKKKRKEIYEMLTFYLDHAENENVFLKVKMRNEKKKCFSKIKRAHLKVELKEFDLPHFLKPCLIIMHHLIQYRLSLGRHSPMPNFIGGSNSKGDLMKFI